MEYFILVITIVLIILTPIAFYKGGKIIIHGKPLRKIISSKMEIAFSFLTCFVFTASFLNVFLPTARDALPVYIYVPMLFYFALFYVLRGRSQVHWNFVFNIISISFFAGLLLEEMGFGNSNWVVFSISVCCALYVSKYEKVTASDNLVLQRL